MNVLLSQNTQQRIDQIKTHPSQAYIFYGQEGLGKLAAAHELAMSLLKQKDSANSLSAGHSNLIVLAPLEGKKSISIAQVRELNESIWRTAQVSTVPRVVIVNRIDTISLEAANAMLKNLEDSPASVVFVMLANSIGSVLPTIRSRAQLVHFSQPPVEQLETVLRVQQNLSDSVVQTIVRVSHGMPRVAFDLLDSQEREKYQQTYTQAQEYVSGSITQRFLVAKTVHEQKNGMEFLHELIYAIRGQSGIVEGVNEVNNLELLLQSEMQLTANVSTRSLLENLALQLTL